MALITQGQSELNKYFEPVMLELGLQSLGRVPVGSAHFTGWKESESGKDLCGQLVYLFPPTEGTIPEFGVYVSLPGMQVVRFRRGQANLPTLETAPLSVAMNWTVDSMRDMLRLALSKLVEAIKEGPGEPDATA